MDTTTRLTVLRALRDLTDRGHPDITPAAISQRAGKAPDYAWQELARCRADGLAEHNGAAMCSWSITEQGRAWLRGGDAALRECERRRVHG